MVEVFREYTVHDSGDSEVVPLYDYTSKQWWIGQDKMTFAQVCERCDIDSESAVLIRLTLGI